ncbi:MAG TPA: alanine racemase [Usitatibacter sp.]|jgi:D-serine deaminase-like pyridoxal phosphate-dependent protein|nr:alanine racemase [Usitatibacter sp.]
MAPKLDHIDTPALLLDAKKLERNCRRMRSIVLGHGVALRPHVKTAKSVEVTQIALDAPAGAITVSTLREAEYFFDHGFRDILYAVGMAPAKLRRVVDLIKRGARMGAIVDSVEAATVLSRAVASSGVRIPTLIEIDSDGHRAGVPPDDARLLAIAEALGGSLQGVMTHAGDSYNCETTEAIKTVAERERSAVVDAARRLRENGRPCEVVSVGSTPTATFAASFEGVTEVRTGVYMFQDLVMAGLGVCDVDDIALSVLATVIGHQREKGWVITDAGWMSLSRDRGTARQKVDQGYGVVCDVEGQPIDGLIVADANQEHGIIARRDGTALDVSRFPIGSRLRVLPNHACATAAQHGEYNVVREGEPIEVWERFGGW